VFSPDISFFVIGAARCGTTSIYSYLTQHPRIAIPTIKEPRFFTQNWKEGWDWYAEVYGNIGPGEIASDFSPGYSNMSINAKPARRIAKFYPDARIIYLVRHPITFRTRTSPPTSRRGRTSPKSTWKRASASSSWLSRVPSAFSIMRDIRACGK